MFQTTKQLFHSLVDIIIVRRQSIGHKHDKPRVVMLMSFFRANRDFSNMGVAWGAVLGAYKQKRDTYCFSPPAR